jgi:hypothetical protein
VSSSSIRRDQGSGTLVRPSDGTVKRKKTPQFAGKFLIREV